MTRPAFEDIADIPLTSGAAAIVVVLERSGSDDLTRGDRAWFALVADACRAARVVLRGPILCSEHGFRRVAPEDCLA